MAVPQHFNINLWKMDDYIPGIYDVCTNAIGVCTGGERSLAYRSSINPEIAEAISGIYVDTYLEKLGTYRTSKDQRSAHYNKTIDNVRRACTADVEVTGISKVCTSFFI